MFSVSRYMSVSHLCSLVEPDFYKKLERLLG